MTTPATPLPAKPAPPPLVRQILLTGARGGIGRATAARLADTGHVVFAGARRADQLQALAATHPGIRSVVLGITDQASIDRDAWPAPGGLLLAGRWLAARPPSAGRWPTRRPARPTRQGPRPGR